MSFLIIVRAMKPSRVIFMCAPLAVCQHMGTLDFPIDMQPRKWPREHLGQCQSVGECVSPEKPATKRAGDGEILAHDD
jgi:hypothetical protein